MSNVFDKSLSFLNDAEKMIDFVNLTRGEFLESYSYLTEEEYEATFWDFMERIMEG